jgi:hypothetical protein
LPAASTTNSTNSPVITRRDRDAHAQWRPSKSRFRARESSARGSRCSCVFIVLQAVWMRATSMACEPNSATRRPAAKRHAVRRRYPCTPRLSEPSVWRLRCAVDIVRLLRRFWLFLP